MGDSGIKLSGGQRQRLAIARSIIKRPAILILDEATSAIDVRGERLVQAALDRVSEGRTTITIAHRLSTIKKADKIIVLKKGKVVEEGNHESLLSNPDGAYWALVNAQQLTMGERYADESDLVEGTKDEILTQIMSTASGGAAAADDKAAYQPRGLVKSFGLLLSEQKSQFIWYTLLIAGCVGAASAYPLQAYIFAKILGVVVLPFSELPAASAHWALMFFVLALAVGFTYFVMGSTSNVISVVCSIFFAHVLPYRAAIQAVILLIITMTNDITRISPVPIANSISTAFWRSQSRFMMTQITMLAA